jgi:protein-disulfide isomerase
MRISNRGKLGIRGTPAIILPNGSIIPGYKEAESYSPIDKSLQ